MKKRLFIILILGIFFITGCTEFNKSENLLKDNYFESLDKIKFYSNVNYKELDNDKDITEMLSLLKKIEGEKLNLSTLEEKEFLGDSFKLEFKYDDRDKKIISFINNKMFYENNWYLINVDMENLYDNINSKENIDNDRIKTQLKKKERKKTFGKNMLIGKWKYNNDSIIQFTNKELIQKNRIFKYKVNTYTDNKIYLTVYSQGRLFNKNKKIFDMYISLDENNINMKMKKVMVGSKMTYKDNLIFINHDNLEIGDFSSFFFIEK